MQIVGLLTTLSKDYDRISMHGVRRTLLEAQAEALELDLTPIFIPAAASDAPCPSTAQVGTSFVPNSAYEHSMFAALTELKVQGIDTIIHGDIFLEDLRAYRDRMLAAVGLNGLYPLWQTDTRQLIEAFLAQGFRAYSCCIDASKLDRHWVGRPLDRAFFEDLPSTIDPCGENGEYHSFVWDGPIFKEPIAITRGECVYRDPGFWFQDFSKSRVCVG